jgi:hypothetical protein
MVSDNPAKLAVLIDADNAQLAITAGRAGKPAA